MKKVLCLFILAFASVSISAQTSTQGRSVDVRAFGAKCDASTNDTTAIAAAITAVTTTGGVVNLPDGTCVVTGLTVPGGVTLKGKGRDVTFIKSTTNAVIVNAVQGSGAFVFTGPEIYDLTIRGSVSAGSSQIGLKLDDVVYYARAVVQGVTVNQAGSHGLYVGNVFSSRFVDVYSDNNAGYPFLINSANMPSNHYESLYAQILNSGGNAGFRVLAGNFICISCNGVNSSAEGSYNAIIGSKIGVDGSAANVTASAHWINCNFESAQAGGILHYYNSKSSFSGHNQFAGDTNAGASTTLSSAINSAVTTIPVTSSTAFNASGTVLIDTELISYTSKSAGNLLGATRGIGGTTAASHLISATVTDNVYIALKYEVDSSLFPPFFAKGSINDDTIFANSPAAFYANSSPIWSNDVPPLTIDGQGPLIAGGVPQTTYRNTTNSRSESLYRSDGYGYVTTVTATANGTFGNPGVRYIEANCAINCTVTLPYAGYYQPGEFVTVKNISADAVVVTVTASSSTVNGGTYTMSLQGQSVTLFPNPTALDYRTVADKTNASAVTGTGTVDYYPIWNSTTSITASGSKISNVGSSLVLTGGILMSPDNTLDFGGASDNRIRNLYIGTQIVSPKYLNAVGGASYVSGSATPESAITAEPGSIYLRTNGSWYIKLSGSGNTGWSLVSTGAPALTTGQVGYGIASVLGGSTDFTYATASKTLTITNGSGTAIVNATGTTSGSGFRTNGAVHPGSGGGLILPFVGGDITTGPGITWTDQTSASGNYAATSSFFIKLGFNLQGASSAHDSLKIRKGTGAAVEGGLIYELRPTDGYFQLYPFGTSTGNTTTIRFTELAAGGSNYIELKAADAIAGNVTLTLPLTATASLNFGATAAGACDLLTITVTGAADGDIVDLGIPIALVASDSYQSFQGYVSASNTVTVKRCNLLNSGAALSDAAAATVRAAVWRYQ